VQGTFNGLTPKEHVIAAIAQNPQMSRQQLWDKIKDYSGIPSKNQMKLLLSTLQKDQTIKTKPIEGLI
jgi:predicted DNA-binding protein YlxM (UPF0122 family)